jgi:hypothetical protein
MYPKQVSNTSVMQVSTSLCASVVAADNVISFPRGPVDPETLAQELRWVVVVNTLILSIKSVPG